MLLGRRMLIFGTIVLLSTTTVSSERLSDFDIPSNRLVTKDFTYHHFLPKDSTLGRGFEVRYDIGSKTTFRFEHYYTKISNTDLHKGFIRSLERQLLSHAIIFDWHPFGGHFRTSIGVVINKHQLYGLTFDGNQFLLKSQRQIGNDIANFSANIDFNKYAPYIGVGWTNDLHQRSDLRYSFDIGLMYHGRPDVRLHLSDPVGNVGGVLSSQQISARLREGEALIEARLNNARVFPVISFGLHYRF